MKKIIAYKRCEGLIDLIEQGKAYVVKEHGKDEISYFVFSTSGHPYGKIDRRWKYMFEKVLLTHGSGDGLFDDCHQSSK